MVHDVRALSIDNWVTASVAFAIVPLLIVGAALGQEKQVSKPVTKDGLSLTISLDKRQYRPAEPIKLSFVLKNESTSDVFVADGYLGPEYQEVGPGRHFEVELMNDDNTRIRFWSARGTEGFTLGIRKVFYLKPGKDYRGSILVRSDGQENGGTFEVGAPGKRYDLRQAGARYAITLKYQVKPKTHAVWKPPIEFSENLLWKGTLESEPLTFDLR